MVEPILTTKLNIPSRRRNLVPRRRLLDRLSQGLHRKLTLVSAPAGFGKTTLLVEWLQSLEATDSPPARVGWLSLDDGDNDPARFSAYLAEALRRAEGSAVQVGGDRWSSSFLQSDLIELINRVEALPQRLVLVLDDYHLVTSQVVHDAVAFFIDHQPENLHLVIATRADPPLPLPRLRARGHLTEVRQSDLCFTTEEASAFLNTLMGLDLSPRDVEDLEARTEGWIAGLQMAALSLQGHSLRPATRSEFVQAFTGSHRFVLDYLVEEVLEQQPPALQNFLLQTSILEHLTGPLCDAVVGGRCSQATLEELEVANLFIVPLDHERHWYRYHHLFSDLLHKRLLQTSPELVPVLHHRASAWYEEQGLMEDAIEHALDGCDFERAAGLIEANIEATLMRSEVVTFVNWVDRLPEEVVCTRPTLCFFHAWALLVSGRPFDAVERRLRDVSQAQDESEGTGVMAGRMAVLNAYLMIYQADMERAAGLCHEALEQLPESERFLRSVATWIIGLANITGGELRDDVQGLEDLVRMGQEMGNPLIAVTALCYQARLQTRRGRLHRAREILERALQLATDVRGRPLPIASEPLIALGELWWEWDDLEKAERCLIESIELSEQWSEMASFDAYFPLMRVKLAQGDVEAARKAIERARQIALKSRMTEVDDLLSELHFAHFFVSQGDVEGVKRWAERRGLMPVELSEVSLDRNDSQDFVAAHLRKYEYLVLARLFILQEPAAEVLDLLRSLLAHARNLGRVDLIIAIQILRALAYQLEDRDDLAMDAFAEALSLAEPEGYVRTFLDEGEPVIRLLRQAASHGVCSDYVLKLLAAYGETDTGATPSLHQAQPLVDPLSERELEVLRLLATGMSNPEIAEELIVAVSTVRSHCKSIYGKLNVHSRWDAVQRGRELGLI